MNYRNVYRAINGAYFLGRAHETPELAADASRDELNREPRTQWICLAADHDDTALKAGSKSDSVTPKERIMAALVATGALIQADAQKEFEQAVDLALSHQFKNFKRAEARSYLEHEGGGEVVAFSDYQEVVSRMLSAFVAEGINPTDKEVLDRCMKFCRGMTNPRMMVDEIIRQRMNPSH